MSCRLLITRWKNCYFTGLHDGKQFVQMNLEPAEQESILGNIYVGRVQNIVKNIRAAFVEFQPGQAGYLSLEDARFPVYTRKQSSGTKLASGDELLVQVSREAVKTKQPTLSAHLSLTGQYSVLTYGRAYAGVSEKIRQEEDRKRLRSLAEEYGTEEIGFIIRTNAAKAEEREIREELERHLREFAVLRDRAVHCAPFTRVLTAPPAYLSELTDSYSWQIQEIVTDCPDAARRCRLFYEEAGRPAPQIRFYEDEISLARLYGIEAKLQKALARQVWLNSGGYLVIEPTEALTVIDVNTGKAVKKGKQTSDTFFRLNMEAAAEAARQIRLRNLSGIILIDFIDMTDAAQRTALIREMERLCAGDPVKTSVVDMTALQLMELTRKKIRRPLAEQAREVREP